MIYLDHNATTPVAPGARDAMMPFLEDQFGNPSSGYPLGRRAADAIEKARKQLASLIGAGPGEVVFTSGGTESNNMVLKGMVDLQNAGSYHMITSPIEHPAILNPALFLMEKGVEVTILSVDAYGRVDPDEVKRAISPRTVLISIMLANNETGTLQPLKEIARIAREKDQDIAVHTDAAQAVGKIPVDVRELGVDFLTIAGHKLYAPKGVGALFIRNGRTLPSLIHGAGQEGGRRAGTENVILAVGLGAASRIARERLDDDAASMSAMRNRLESLLFEALEELVLNGHRTERLPNTLNVSVPRIEGQRILDGLPSVMASTGAACHERSVRLSHVLSAMGVSREAGMGALRFSVGRLNTMEHMNESAGLIIQRIKEIKYDRS